MKKSVKIELLAPARDLVCGRAAIDHGADAVYIGPRRGGARVAAGNPTEDIAQLCLYAHDFGARVYATVNTIVYNEELGEVRRLLDDLALAGVDAVLAQDMAVVQMAHERGLYVHASTQTDNRTAEQVAWLSGVGCRRVVLARELSLDEIAAIHRAVPQTELEVFVHGALCVSYSGQCYASQFCKHRSANRGACAQICRMKYDLVDANGQVIESQRHLLSLKDLCQIDALESLLEAGAVSLKIEGRLKDEAYVRNVVAAYSKRLDRIIEQSGGRYERASLGRVAYGFAPDLQKTFNRGYTQYFLYGRQKAIASLDTPKVMGERVGKVKELFDERVGDERVTTLTVSGTTSFSNGDGLCFFNTDHNLVGFRVNRVVNNRLYPFRIPQGLLPGMVLYRNNDQAFERLMATEQTVRRIPVSMDLCQSSGRLILSASLIGTSIAAESTASVLLQDAHKVQAENMRRQLTKLGNTPFVCESITLSGGVENYFVPSSVLSRLRRMVVESLLAEIHAQTKLPSSCLPNEQRSEMVLRNTDLTHPANSRPRPELLSFPYLSNVSNEMARQFYEHLGTVTGAAFELLPEKKGEEVLLMQCRYCLKYELGHCLRHALPHRPHASFAKSWHEPLHLVSSDGARFRLEFKCNTCQMFVYGTRS